jgi:isoaspartyl peptidase/L-asparaginase-like protein (Ntn-hydrolase superfamily)
MTSDGRVGAACAMPGVRHAVDVARAVAVETPHVCLAGGRAVDFAASRGIETDRDLWTDATRTRWAKEDAPADGSVDDQVAWVGDRFGRGDSDRDDGRRDHDTVGVVATDGETVAAATSTGGRWGALAGRVGDVPQVGAGFYATDAGAASATGHGEAIARAGLARRAVDRLADGDDPAAAARGAIDEFERRTDGEAGVILLAPDGATGTARNSAAMPTAAADDAD